jgi:phosphodiesterase/alkaline phosphatase D-like protein
MHLERRIFLAQSARVLSLASIATAVPTTLRARTSSYPFGLGIALGSPRPTGAPERFRRHSAEKNRLIPGGFF